MTSTTTSPATASPTSGTSDVARRRVPGPVPFGRLVGVEVRKTGDTRSSRWILLALGLLAAGACAVVLGFMPSETWTYGTFLDQISYPLALGIPMLAVLSVAGEWGQRSALTTFTLVPRRGRVVAAKAAVAAGYVVVTMALAFGLAALCTLVAGAAAGDDAASVLWDVPVGQQLRLVLFMAVAMAVGFTLAVVLRHTAAAMVGYLLIALVLPNLSSLLASVQDWYRDAAPWVEITSAQYNLLGPDAPTGEQWAQLGTTVLLWIVLPLTLGVRRLLRVEIR
ncbi:ABC transporter permease subunit [Isoptericola sp. BMS4]|uniref:ABC transporter permease subunit n=1 Tax=Isoptericola sp. BMS4 TaxID=2527875 RepID=UPI00142486D7|nr:ABC transporter permease subunit [Isoptericola sp. BMS4]